MVIRIVKLAERPGDYGNIDFGLWNVPDSCRQGELTEKLQTYWGEFMDSEPDSDSQFSDFVLDRELDWKKVPENLPMTIEIV